MKSAGGWILLGLLAGCLETPRDPTCGGSVGCGNPPSLAELQISETSCPSTACGGLTSPTPFNIGFGDSLRIEIEPIKFTNVDSIQREVLLYQGFQVPVYSPNPIDKITMNGNSIVLHPEDLVRARAAAPQADTGTFAFSIQIISRIYSKNIPFEQEALLAGLGLEKDSSHQFVSSPKNPLQDTGVVHYLQETIAYFEGTIQNWHSLASDSDSAYVYIPGSPYFNVISISDGHFRLASLPLNGQFELRMFVVPRILPGNRKVPSYILSSGPGETPVRVFTFKETSDSLLIPEVIP